MKRIFILYSFSIVDVHIFLYKFGQTLCSLTLTKSYMRSKKKRREYYIASTTTIQLVGMCTAQHRRNKKREDLVLGDLSFFQST